MIPLSPSPRQRPGSPTPSNRSILVSGPISASLETFLYLSPGDSDTIDADALASFKKVFRGHHDFTSGVYKTAIYPIVQSVIAGQDTLLVIGGGHSPAFVHKEVLFVQEDAPGILRQITSQLLHARTSSQNSTGSLTFAWMKMDCVGEHLTDLLRVNTKGYQIIPQLARTIPIIDFSRN